MARTHPTATRNTSDNTASLPAARTSMFELVRSKTFADSLVVAWSCLVFGVARLLSRGRSSSGGGRRVMEAGHLPSRRARFVTPPPAIRRQYTSTPHSPGHARQERQGLARPDVRRGRDPRSVSTRAASSGRSCANSMSRRSCAIVPDRRAARPRAGYVRSRRNLRVQRAGRSLHDASKAA